LFNTWPAQDARLGVVDIYLSAGDCEEFCVLTKRGEEEWPAYFDEPQRRQRGKGPQSDHQPLWTESP